MACSSHDVVFAIDYIVIVLCSPSHSCREIDIRLRHLLVNIDKLNSFFALAPPCGAFDIRFKRC